MKSSFMFVFFFCCSCYFSVDLMFELLQTREIFFISRIQDKTEVFSLLSHSQHNTLTLDVCGFLPTSTQLCSRKQLAVL